MSAATIIFIDIVGFSKKPTSDQKILVNSLTSEVIHALWPLLNPPLKDPEILTIPTGDGLALSFMHTPMRQWNRSNIFELIVKLQKWSEDNSDFDAKVSLRFGVHVGSVEIVTDINGRPNLIGDTINYSQRVMDSADPKQVLFSEAAFSEYIGTELIAISSSPFSKENPASFEGPFEIHVKHARSIQVYKMILEKDVEWWSNADPSSAGQMIVNLTPLPKEIIGSFSEKILAAKNIAFIQLTGDRFLDKYNKGEIKFSTDINRLWVFMPNPDTYGSLNLTAPHASKKYLEECVKNWKKAFLKIKKDTPKAELKLGLFEEPPFFGASFIDWDRPDGMIHVSPYVWNITAPECPGYDLQWIGKKPTKIYETYVKGLQYLNAQTLNSL